ncbi:acetamidase/formamidase family protein [Bifidobacterium adolescentis]|uniref:acetamidase/formamidase family protein n=1 Tax=Bifidobacterium adolescentis TaxID=1680 RepID=UPI00189F00F5
MLKPKRHGFQFKRRTPQTQAVSRRRRYVSRCIHFWESWTTTASNQRPSSIPPADYGGNIDLRNLTVESTLFLPVQIEGAGLYIDDPHFAQDDGEVSLTALEASLRATLRVQVVPTAETKRTVRTHGSAICDQSWHADSNGFQQYAG